MELNYYDILGVSKEFTPEELKKAYRILCKEHHPDQGGDSEFFLIIKKAYDTLSDPKKRDDYDLYGVEDENLKLIISCAIMIFKRAIDTEGFNLEIIIKDIYKELVKATEDQIISCNNNINKNEGIINRIFLSPKNDFIGNALRSEIKAHKKSIENFKNAKKDLDTAYEMLNAYMFDNPQQEYKIPNMGFESYKPITGRYY